MKKVITFTLNGEEFEVKGSISVLELVSRLQLKSETVAVELDRRIIPRNEWAESEITGGSTVEIVHFVGGGRSFDE